MYACITYYIPSHVYYIIRCVPTNRNAIKKQHMHTNMMFPKIESGAQT